MITGLSRRRWGVGRERRYPLASRSPAVRAWIVAACLYVMFNDRFMEPADEVLFGFRPSLPWLAAHMDPKRRAEFLARARSWPRQLSSPFVAGQLRRRQIVEICGLGDLIEAFLDVAVKR